MKPKLRALLLALIAIASLAGFALLLSPAGKPVTLPPLPSPNGYDDFIKAGTLVGNDVGDAFTMKTDDLRELISTNQEALRLFRLGLSRKCQVPIQTAWINEMAVTNDDTYLIELASMKRLAHLLNAEGRLAEMEHRPAEAARTYIELMRFGNEISRGGFLIHRLVGIACEAIGYAALAKVVPQLNCEQSRTLLVELERVDKQAVTWNGAMQAEKVFIRHELRQSFNPIVHIMGWWQYRQAIKRVGAKQNFAIAHRHLLTTELALRCYQAEQGHTPEQLDQLVPKYLQRVPTDPFSGQPLIYRPQGTNWLLYSVGPDKVDKGGNRTGKIASSNGATGDLFFDSP